MRSDEDLWNMIKDEIQSIQIMGTRAHEWSARKAQLAVKMYKQLGGTYTSPKRKSSLSEWTAQDWTTKSGLPSSVTGERYLPRRAIEELSPSEQRRTSRRKRDDTLRGRQYSAQPSDIAKKTSQYR